MTENGNEEKRQMTLINVREVEAGQWRSGRVRKNMKQMYDRKQGNS